jgi:hypothetical protein
MIGAYTSVHVHNRMLGEDVTSTDLTPLAEASVVRLKVPTWASPLVTLTFSGFHNVNAVTGPADQ